MGLIPESPLTGLGFIGAFGPLVAAILVTGIFERGAGLKTLFRRAFDTHFRKIWWLPIFLVLPLLVIGAFYLAAGIDGVTPPFPPEANPPWMLFFVFFSVLFLSGPFEEEFGWRGYALPRLQAKYSALVSSLILGIIWALWHVPQFLIPNNGMFYKTPIWTFIPTVTAATVIFTWIYNHTNGSLLASLLTHTMFNLSMFLFPVLDTKYGYLLVLAFFAIGAVAIVLVFGPRALQREKKDVNPA